MHLKLLLTIAAVASPPASAIFNPDADLAERSAGTEDGPALMIMPVDGEEAGSVPSDG